MISTRSAPNPAFPFKMLGALLIALALCMVLFNGAGVIKTGILIAIGTAMAMISFPALFNANTQRTIRVLVGAVAGIVTAFILTGIHAYFS